MADEGTQQRTPVRVVIADDHPVFREGLVCGLARREDIAVVGAAGDGAEAVLLVERTDPDVVVLDVEMPLLDGMGALERLNRAGARARVLLLSGHATSELAYLAMALGAGGYLTKAAEFDEIADAVVAVAGGATVLSSQIQTALADEIQQRGAAERPVLTDREQQILAMLAEGRSAPAMAGELHLSPATVKTHLTRLYDKLGVSDRAAAVAVGMRRGLLQ
jgi:two-component system nitrate/nitrite response regulator NarL